LQKCAGVGASLVAAVVALASARLDLSEVVGLVVRVGVEQALERGVGQVVRALRDDGAVAGERACRFSIPKCRRLQSTG